MSSGSKKKKPRYTCLSEAKASHPQRMWTEVSSSALHLQHSGLSSSPSRWRCLSPQGIMSSQKASNSPELSPVKGQKPSLGTQKRRMGVTNMCFVTNGDIFTLNKYKLLMNDIAQKSWSFDAVFLACPSLLIAKLYEYSGYHLTGIHSGLSWATWIENNLIFLFNIYSKFWIYFNFCFQLLFQRSFDTL